MADAFFSLSRRDQADALGVAADRAGRPVHLLEKDVWVVWALEALYAAPFSHHLVFKGGTSLSKAYDVIARFSEDVDLTYDIRAIAPDLAEAGTEPIPVTPSQEQKWTKTIRTRLHDWTANTVAPTLESRLAELSSTATVGVDGATVTVTYELLATGTGYVRPVVLLEFGARSSGAPSEPRTVTCDAAVHVPEVAFPSATAIRTRSLSDICLQISDTFRAQYCARTQSDPGPTATNASNACTQKQAGNRGISGLNRDASVSQQTAALGHSATSPRLANYCRTRTWISAFRLGGRSKT